MISSGPHGRGPIAASRWAAAAARGCAWLCGALVWLGFGIATPVDAHRLNNSRATVRVTQDTLRLEVAVDESDLVDAFPLDRNGDGILWRDEMVAGIPLVSAYVAARLAATADGEPVSLVRRTVYVDPDVQGNLYLNLRFTGELDGAPRDLELRVDLFERFREGHKTLATVTPYGGPPQPAVFSATARQRSFVLREEAFPGWAGLTLAAAAALVAGAVAARRRSRRTTGERAV